MNRLHAGTILVFMLLEQLFKVALCVAGSRLSWDAIFFILPNAHDLNILVGKKEVVRPSLYCQ